mgnify:CR=1 FL=1
MPCLECENEMWRFGETGKCQYATKSECEKDNEDYTYSEDKIKEDFERYFKEIITKLTSEK